MLNRKVIAVLSEVYMNHRNQPYVISVFRRAADENCALLGYYAGSTGNS